MKPPMKKQEDPRIAARSAGDQQQIGVLEQAITQPGQPDIRYREECNAQ